MAVAPSLQAALSLLDRFSVISGLKVNWPKSKILLLRLHPMPGPAVPTTPLQWVTQIKYFGLVITNLMADYIGLNISPLLAILNQKLNTWKNLPLLLIGKIHLIKIKILPLVLYVLRNTPVWIPKSIF